MAKSRPASPKKILLRPIKETTEDFEALERAIKDLFKREVFYPILKELGEPKRVITNAMGSDLLDAIRTGRITFDRGTFLGRLNAGITKDLRELGARWDRKTGTFKIPQSALPLEIRNAVSASAFRFDEKIARIDRKLAQILPEEFADKLQASKFFDRTLWKVDKDLRSSLQAITVSPKLSDESRQRIADEWQTNMRLWIRDFTQEEIVKLRKGMQESVFAGNRYESAVKTIQESYGVTERKAKFLARQETSLLMAKFKETRYVAAGVLEYEWGCVHMPKDKTPSQHTPGNVRYSHGVLEGKIFRWDTPPITTEPGEPVRRNNPGQDYNCRCFAKPVVRFK